MAAKITWKALTSAKTIPDPAVRGEGYLLRYRGRKGGVFAELRYKAPTGKWTAYRLGRVPAEWEARALRDPLLTQVPVSLLGQMDERTIEQLSPPVRRSRSSWRWTRSASAPANWSRSFGAGPIRAPETAPTTCAR